MCGTLDDNLDTTQEFVRTLETMGYSVETEWPRTPHTCNRTDPQTGRRKWDQECDAEFGPEFERYSRRVADFFLRVTQRK